MTIQKILIGSMCAVGFVLGSSRLASATSFALNQSACCGTGPFGTITLSQYDVNSVNVLVNLNAGIGFVDTGNAAPGNHPDLAWTLLGDPAGVSISLVQTGGDGWTFYDRQSHPVNMSDSFGKYEYALYCNGTPACGSGGSDPNFGPLEFRVIFPNITPAWFIPNAAGTVFAADIINGYPNGATGLVRTTGPDGGRETTDVVPEPTTLLLVGGGLVAGLRKRKRVV